MDIDEAATWFFEAVSHEYPNTLRLKLVEGIKGTEREMVEITDEQSLGPYFPVRVTEASRCIDISFDSVIAYQIVDESYAAPQTDFDAEPFLGPVQRCKSVEYLTYLEKDSLISTLRENEYVGYYIWTEDQSVFIVSMEQPTVEESDGGPDLTIERSLTYFAS